MIEEPNIGHISIETRRNERLDSLIDDLSQAYPIAQSKIKHARLSDTEPDILIIALGATIKAGQSRDELFKENISAVFDRLGSRIPGTPFVITVTNPVDAITDAIRLKYNVPQNKIAGIGGDLDANRVRWAMNANKSDVLILGEHSESAVVMINSVTLDKLSIGKNIRDKIRESLFSQLTHFGAPTYCPGMAITHLIRSVIGKSARSHLLSIYHPQWDNGVTWPVMASGYEATLLPLHLDKDVFEKVSAIASKNRHISRSFLSDKKYSYSSLSAKPNLSPLEGNR